MIITSTPRKRRQKLFQSKKRVSNIINYRDAKSYCSLAWVSNPRGVVNNLRIKLLGDL